MASCQSFLYHVSFERVKNHLYCRWNLRLLNVLSPSVEEALGDALEMEQALVEDDNDQEGQFGEDPEEATTSAADQDVIQTIR